MYDLVVKGGTVFTGKAVLKCDVAISDGVITALGFDMKGTEEIDASSLYVLPGVIDPHVHMALPVRGDRSSDDFLSGSIAAAAGGVTSIVDFTVGSSDSSIPDDIDKRLLTASSSIVDYGFHCEVIGWNHDRAWEIEDAISKGAQSFKFFTAYGASGRRSDSGVLYDCFKAIAKAGALAIVHCEDDDLIDMLSSSLSKEQLASMVSLGVTRPDICEGAAIDQVAYYSEITGARCHIVHVSSAIGVERVRRARERGVAITGETCPQYLLLDREVYRRPDGHLYSASPALRTKADREALWGALKDGSIDFVATDHCPFTRAQKKWKGDFRDLPYGLPGVETLLPLVFSEGVLSERIDMNDLVRLLSQRASEIYNLKGKGSISVGKDADLVLFNPREKWTIREEDLNMKVDFSPYEGYEVTGKVMTTISRGDIIFNCGHISAEQGRGHYMKR